MSFSIDILTPAQAAILLGIAAVLGACLGSFINCLAWRMVNDESVMKGRSHCPSCEHTLGVVDLVPVVSWFALRGRCRHCGQGVSPRYVVVELAMAVLFVALAVAYGMNAYTIVYWVLACVLMGAALVDLDTYTIPNGFVIAIIVAWVATMVLAWAGLAPWEPTVSSGGDLFGVGSMFVPFVGESWVATALDGLVGSVVIGGGILAFSLLFDAVTKRTSLGGGDVKLLFAVGLFLGLVGSLLNLLIACIVGLGFALVSGLFTPSSSSVDSHESQQGHDGGKKESFGTKAIPFGPAIAVATMVTLLVGPFVLTWYTGLFL